MKLSGFPYFSPIGEKIKINLEGLLANECEKKGFSRIQIPSMHRRELVERSGKYSQFKNEFIDVAENYVLTSTSEEYLLELARAGLESYTQLPIRLFEIGNAIRMIQRPQGILKLREFNGVVLTTFEENKEGYKSSLSIFKGIVQNILDTLRIPFMTNEKNEGVEYFYYPSTYVPNEPLSLAMGYKYKPVCQQEIGCRTKKNELNPITVGTFGIGLERLFYSACDSCRDYLGFGFPEAMLPYRKAVIVINPKYDKQMMLGENIYFTERNNGNSVYLEDRNSLTLKEKLDYADFLGVREKIIIGKKEIEEGKPLIKMRDNI